MSRKISRRTFLRQANCAAVGTSAILNTLLNLRLANGVVGQGGPLDSRALVCIFLSGGMDSFNMLVPWEATRYSTYSVTRGTFGSDGEWRRRICRQTAVVIRHERRNPRTTDHQSPI